MAIRKKRTWHVVMLRNRQAETGSFVRRQKICINTIEVFDELSRIVEIIRVCLISRVRSALI